MKRIVGAALVALASGAALVPSCADESGIEPAPRVTCRQDAANAGLEALPPGVVAVHLDAPDDLQLAFVRADLERYLGEMWGEPVTIRAGRPDGSSMRAIVLTTNPADASASALDTGYALTQRGPEIVVWGSSSENLVYGAYALVEELGARFFHPAQEVVPRWGAPHLPPAIGVVRAPAFATRSLQLHTLHPIEAYEALNEPGAANFAGAKRLVDWLVKTGHNAMQFYTLGGGEEVVAMVPHYEAVVAYAHERGVKVTLIVQLFAGSSLQNGFTLDRDEATAEADVQANLATLAAVPWDGLELALGEFLAEDPERVVSWLDLATAVWADVAPGAEISTVNHVGNYPDLWVTYEGEETFFYHLPRYADPRLINTAHTVFFFDLYRPWGSYGHEDFFLHREFLFEELPKRTMRYTLESAYWASADIDVPIFLPSYLTGRAADVRGLWSDTLARGLPPVEGHVLFSSGHEWGYWLADYVTARMLWDPGAPVADHLAHVGRGLGTCGERAVGAVGELIALEDAYLFDRRLAGYLSGEDLADDFGFAIGIVTTPRRVAFEDVYARPAEERAAFAAQVVAGLDAFYAETEAVEERIRSACGLADEALDPSCSELVDAVEITRLRAFHAAHLYKAVLAAAEGNGLGPGELALAEEARGRAAAVVARREATYRYPVERLAGQRPNKTIYPFGYLQQASTLCFWRRQEDQARAIVETGAPLGAFSLPTCSE